MYNSKEVEQVERWMRGFAVWRLFITLTFEDDTVSRETATAKFRKLLQILNTDLYGHHYTRIVGHCYFSYVIAWERQKRGAWHIHMLTDDNVNLQLMHDVWKRMSGFSWNTIVKDQEIVGYLTKYITKGGDLDFYAKECAGKAPAFVPMWYMVGKRKPPAERPALTEATSK